MIKCKFEKMRGFVLGTCCIAVTAVVVALIAVLVNYTVINPGSLVDRTVLTLIMKSLNSAYTDNRLYSDTCWLTSHNSFAHPVSSKSTITSIHDLDILPNQVLTIEQQLLFGVKSFMIDLHLKNNEIIIAHEGILFKQPLRRFLNTIKKWLDQYQDEIITIHFESRIGHYNHLIDKINKAGLKPYVFDLGSRKTWPTLGEMRKTNKRLVIFSDNIKDTGTGIMYTNRYMETDFNLTRSPNCEMRYDRRALPSSKPDLFVMNHFYPLTLVAGSYGINFDEKVPYITSKFMKTPNDYKEIQSRICQCLSQYSKLPNFIAVDFVGLTGGKELDIVLDINNKNIKCP